MSISILSMFFFYLLVFQMFLYIHVVTYSSHLLHSFNQTVFFYIQNIFIFSDIFIHSIRRQATIRLHFGSLSIHHYSPDFSSFKYLLKLFSSIKLLYIF